MLNLVFYVLLGLLGWVALGWINIFLMICIHVTKLFKLGGDSFSTDDSFSDDIIFYYQSRMNARPITRLISNNRILSNLCWPIVMSALKHAMDTEIQKKQIEYSRKTEEEA